MTLVLSFPLEEVGKLKLSSCLCVPYTQRDTGFLFFSCNNCTSLYLNFSQTVYNYLFLKIYLFIYLFLAALGPRCCAQAFSSCGEQGLLFVAVHGLLIAVASFVVEHGL